MWSTVEDIVLDAARLLQLLGAVVAIYTVATTDLSTFKRGFKRLHTSWAVMRRRRHSLVVAACLVLGAGIAGFLWNRLGIELPSLSPKMQLKLKLLAIALVAAMAIVLRLRLVPKTLAYLRRSLLALPVSVVLTLGARTGGGRPASQRRPCPGAYRASDPAPEDEPQPAFA